MNERETSVTVKLQRVEALKVDEFKYLKSTFQSNIQFTKEVKKRGRMEWVETSVRNDF